METSRFYVYENDGHKAAVNLDHISHVTVNRIANVLVLQLTSGTTVELELVHADKLFQLLGTASAAKSPN